MTVNIGILSLSYCAGCEVALLTSKKFNEFLAEKMLKIVYSPLLLDVGDIEKIDILLVTGCIRAQDDISMVKEIGKRAVKTAAFGTCPCYGGIPGLANLMSREEIVSYVFDNMKPKAANLKRELVKAVTPLSAVTKVDYFIPGCPPVEGIIKLFLESLVQGGKFDVPKTNVCSACPLNTEDKKPLKGLRRKLLALNDIDTGICFLKQGVLCMGPATLGVCEALCIRKGVPCIGCTGPIPPSKDQAADMIDALSIFYLVEQPEKVLDAIPDPVGLLSMFTLPYSSIPYHRKVEEVEEDDNY